MFAKRFFSSAIAALMCVCSCAYVPAYAAENADTAVFNTTVDNHDDISIPDPDRSRIALGSNASGNFYYSGTVTVTIPSSITSYSANQVGIIIVDRTDGSTGAKFSVECIDKPFHNVKYYTISSNYTWKYYDLVGGNPSGGESRTFKVTLTNGVNMTHQYEVIAGLFYHY